MQRTRGLSALRRVALPNDQPSMLPAVRAGLCVRVDGSAGADTTVCNGRETCLDGMCQSGTPPDCETGDRCHHVIGCNEVTGCQSVNTCPCTNDAECDDHNPCTADACTSGGCSYSPRE